MEPLPPSAEPAAQPSGAPPAEARFQTLVEGLDAIVWEMDASTWEFTYVSPQAERMLGFPVERWYGDPTFWTEVLVHPEDREWAVPFCVSATEQGRDHEFDYRANAADGRVVWLRDVVRVVCEEADAPRLLRGVMIDITEQKQAEHELRERETQLAEAQRIAHLGSWEWDVRSDALKWSDELFRIYGLEPQPEPGSLDSYLARVHPDDRERVAATIRRVYETGATFDFEERIVRPDGEVRVLLSRGRAVQDERGAVVRLVGTCQDVTAQRRDQRDAAARASELALEQAARRRAEEEEQRAAFLAEAGGVLSTSLDYGATLEALAHLAVPRIADWCAVDVVEEDGSVHRLVTAHPDPEMERLAREMERKYPADPDAVTGVPQVLRTGRPELVPRIPPELLEAAAVDDEHLRIIRMLDLHSYMVVPLIARGRTLGAITLVRSETTQQYDEGDLRFAEELAARAALSVDNARLYRVAEQTREQNTRILASITDAFFALDPEWRFSYLNEEAERVLHRPAAELLGRSIWEAFPEARGTSFERAYRQAAEEKRTVEFEEFYPPLETWFDVRAYPSESGVSVFFRDVNERHRAEEALQYQSYLTRTISQNATSALFLMDHRGHCTYLNPAAEAMIGFTLEEIQDAPLHEFIHHHHPDGTPYPMHECPIDRALPENFDIRAHEDVFIRKDGTFFPVVCAASPIFKDRVPVATVVEVRDVTGERVAHTALQESEQRYRFMAEAVPVQIWTASPDGNLDYVSQQTADYFGRSPEEVVGDGWLKVLLPEQVEAVTRRWVHSLTTGEPYEVEFKLRGADGSYDWFLGRAVAQRDAEGGIIRWFGSNTHIGDRKKAEEERERLIGALDAERRRLESIFVSAPAAIAVTRGPEHEFVSANDAYRQLVGRELVGSTLRGAFPDLGDSGFFDLMDAVYATGEPYVGNETLVHFDRDGDGELESGYFNFVYQPLANSAGEVTGVMTLALEVTEQVHARHEVELKADELARLARQLEATNRELDQFAYVASHDLKAPLRGIANLSQWIEEDLEGELNAPVRQHLELLRGRVHRMEGLIDGILQYSRAGRVREKPESVDVGALIEEVVDLLALPGGFEVRVPERMPTLTTERLPLQQVLMNLIGNAAKYADGPEARAVLTSSEEGGAVRFTVSDNGPGIAPEYHERIFGIFQTLEARDKVEGTGIGLSLVRKIVEARGGRVWIESEEGSGASFHFLWPRETRES